MANTITIIDNYIECEWCGRVFTTPTDLLGYDDKIFCDSKCLGEYMVDKADEDIDAVWFDTPENIEICEKEARAEW